MTYEIPEIIEIGKADEVIQGGGNCCYDVESLLEKENYRRIAEQRPGGRTKLCQPPA